MVVGAPDVDEVLPAPLDLVEVIREVVAEIRRVAVRPDEDAVALVAEILAAQPGGAVALVREALGLQA